MSLMLSISNCIRSFAFVQGLRFAFFVEGGLLGSLKKQETTVDDYSERGGAGSKQQGVGYILTLGSLTWLLVASYAV